MQVSTQEDYITHAVVGQQESISMGMSEDAALMHILSSSLYTYTKLAAVREVICNGWDGHILSGITDTPLCITIADNKFSVKDFGPGIPHEKIGAIYGTYGNSTKRTDSAQTGGFGLGSKAPFAYTDNFEVISCNNGTKTIYRVSKATMENGGKPSINKIVSIPTEETGITVSYALLNDGDNDYFRELAKEVLLLGGMRATINGDLYEDFLPLHTSPTGYIISSLQGTLLSRINIRYGNVVYPVPLNVGFTDEWYFVRDVMNSLWDSANIIFMAQPDTITIAPNRESLIFTNGTVETIKNLLSQFTPTSIKNIGNSVEQQLRYLKKKTIHQEPPATNSSEILQRTSIAPSLLATETFKGIGTFAFTLKKAKINHEIGRRLDLSQEESTRLKLAFAIKNKSLPDLPLAKAVLKSIKNGENYFRNSNIITIFHKHVTYPLYSAIADNPTLSKEKLSISHSSRHWTNTKLGKLKEIHQFFNNLRLAFLDKRALVCSSQRQASLFIDSLRGGEGSGWIVYIAGKKQENINKAVSVLSSLGYTVNTQIAEKVVRDKASDHPDYVAPIKKPTIKREGYLSLKQSYCPRTENYLLSTARNSKEPATLSDPVAYVILHNKAHYSGGRWIENYSNTLSSYILKELGDKVAVVTATQATTLTKKGIPSVSAYIDTYVDDTLSQAKDFPRYVAFYAQRKERKYRYCNTAEIINAISTHGVLMDSLGIRFSLTPQTAMLVAFIEERPSTAFPKTRERMDKIKPSPAYPALVKKIQESPWLPFINENKLIASLQGLAPTDTDASKIPYAIVRNLLA